MTDRRLRRSGQTRQPVSCTGSRRKGRKLSPKRGRARRRQRRGVHKVSGFSGGKEGYSVVLTIAERVGRRLDRVTSRLQISSIDTDGGRKTPGGRKKSRCGPKGEGQFPARACQAMFALGHIQRMRILRKLLDGPAIYQALKKLTKLKPGPLYHHINQLRLAGLILPKQRDLYEITRAGRNLALGVTAIAPLVADSRPRPTG